MVEKKALSALEAHAALLLIGDLLAEPSTRVQAASKLVPIAKKLGPERCIHELVPFLTDVVEGPPAFPLLPPTFVDETAEAGDDESGSVPGVDRPVPFDLASRPALSTLMSIPHARGALLRTVIAASETDDLLAEIAKQLSEFLPEKILPLSQAGYIVGLLCHLASNAEISVRQAAIRGIIKSLNYFDAETLLQSGCVDLFLGMATNDNHYKKASVTYVLPRMLPILANNAIGDDLQPLKAEIVKLFFEVSNSSVCSVSKRALGVNFPAMVSTLMSMEETESYSFIKAPHSDRKLNVPLTPAELTLCELPASYAVDSNMELRILALPDALFLAYVLHERWVAPFQPILGPTLTVLAQRPPKRVPASLKLQSCPRCQFLWPKSASLTGVFSLANSTTFQFLYDHMTASRPPKWKEIKAEEAEKYIAAYCTCIEQLVKPIIDRATTDDWMVRLTLVDCVPLIIDLVLPFIQPEECKRFIDQTLLGDLVDDESVEIRCATLQRLPLFLYLLSFWPRFLGLSALISSAGISSGSTSLIDPKATSLLIAPGPLMGTGAASGTGRPIAAVSSSPAVPSATRQSLPATLLSSVTSSVSTACSDNDPRVRSAAAESIVHLALLHDDFGSAAVHFLESISSLLRDQCPAVQLSLVSTLRVFGSRNWGNGPKKEESDARIDKAPAGAGWLKLEGAMPSLRQGNVDFPDQYLCPEFCLPRGVNSLGHSKQQTDAFVESLKSQVINVLWKSLTSVSNGAGGEGLLVSSAPIGSGTQMNAAGGPGPVPLWRVRCAALHLLPAIGGLISKDSFAASNISGSVAGAGAHGRPEAELLKSFKATVFDPAAVTRKCAATSLIEFQIRAPLAHDFMLGLFDVGEKDANIGRGSLNVRRGRLEICQAIAGIFESLPPGTNWDDAADYIRCRPASLELMLTFLSSTRATDSVANLRVGAENCLSRLEKFLKGPPRI